MTENLRDAIEEARERKQPLSPAELRAGWAGVEARVGKPKPVGIWAVAGGLTAIATLLIGFFAFRAPPAIAIAKSQAACAAVDGQHIATNATCASVDAHIDTDEVQLAKATVIERKAKNRLEVVRGRARFNVTRRMTQTDRLEIRVKGGTIIVVGTAFTVEQNDGAGKVSLEHGSIRFVWDDGQAQTLAPGETLAWPRAEPAHALPETTPQPILEEPVQRPNLTKHADPKIEATVEQIMQRQFQLRAQRRYDEAMEVLASAATDKAFTKNQRERFDYELGVLVQAHRPERACAHWKHHRDLFGGTRADVNKALEACR